MNTLLALTATGILVMLSEIFRLRKMVYPVVIAGLLAALGLSVADWDTGIRYFSDMMFFDNYAVCFSAVMILTTLLWFVLSRDYISGHSHEADYTTLIIFALAGGVVMVSYSDLTMLFIGLEILSIAMYIMSASNKMELRSNEAGFKYFMLGAFATGFLLFGIALIYGVTGTFNLQEIGAYVSVNKTNLPLIFSAGLLLMMVGLSFKVAAAPFHFWAPDVYEGAPSPVTAFMSTVVKTAAFASFLRLFSVCFDDIVTWWSPVLAVFAALSMVAGNILAVYQKSIKRMLAFSSIANAGYILLAIVALNDLSHGALLIYTAAYSLASIGIFTLIISMTQNGNENVSSLKGLSKSNPFATFVFTVVLLSLAGIPPVAGFFGKYYLFYGALKNDQFWLVIIAVISSLIGIYYYFRVIITMFQRSDSETIDIQFKTNHYIVMVSVLVLVILLGIMPGYVTDLI